MTSVIQRVALAAVLVLVVAQVIPVDRTNPPVTGDLVGAPAPVADALRRACYDCHSRETVWPWYSRVAPVSWLVAHDVAEGRETLDFSTWQSLAPRKKAKLLEKSVEEVEEGGMPPWYYAFMHPRARLDQAERTALVAWARGEAESVKRADSGTP